MTGEFPPPGEPPRFPPPPPPRYGTGAIVGGILGGLGASVAAPLLSLALFSRWADNAFLAIFGVPLLVLGLAIFFAVRVATRPFGIIFLISFSGGFILLAGVCISVFTSMGGVG